MHTFPTTNTTVTTIPEIFANRTISKGCYPIRADIAEGNRKYADEAITFLENWGYKSDERIAVDQYHAELGRLVRVTGHDNGATVVLVNPFAVVPVMVVDRVYGAVAPWGYVWEDDLV
jgi:hypothetical protein